MSDNTDITTWVAADDDAALPAWIFCEAGAGVFPRKSSSRGFNDELDESVHKLTSFNYNSSAGMLIVRATTGRVSASRLSGGCQGIYAKTQQCYFFHSSIFKIYLHTTMKLPMLKSAPETAGTTGTTGTV